jgi:hypothetical protein
VQSCPLSAKSGHPTCCQGPTRENPT